MFFRTSAPPLPGAYGLHQSPTPGNPIRADCIPFPDGKRPQADSCDYRSENGFLRFLPVPYIYDIGSCPSRGNSSDKTWEHIQASCQTRSAHAPDPCHSRYAGRAMLFSGFRFSSYPEWKQSADSGGYRTQNVPSLCGRQLSAVCRSVFLSAGAGTETECTLAGLLLEAQYWRWRSPPDSFPF